MREFWTLIGGVAVGILAATGVFATEDEYKPYPNGHDEDDTEEAEDETEEANTVRPSSKGKSRWRNAGGSLLFF